MYMDFLRIAVPLHIVVFLGELNVERVVADAHRQMVLLHSLVTDIYYRFRF